MNWVPIIVTSWAVRLNHPETTWPGMLAERHWTRPLCLSERRSADSTAVCWRA